MVYHWGKEHYRFHFSHFLFFNDSCNNFCCRAFDNIPLSHPLCFPGESSPACVSMSLWFKELHLLARWAGTSLYGMNISFLSGLIRRLHCHHTFLLFSETCCRLWSSLFHFIFWVSFLTLFALLIDMAYCTMGWVFFYFSSYDMSVIKCVANIQTLMEEISPLKALKPHSSNLTAWNHAFYYYSGFLSPGFNL